LSHSSLYQTAETDGSGSGLCFSVLWLPVAFTLERHMVYDPVYTSYVVRLDLRCRFSTYRDFIRTVPVLQHDPDRPEDVDTAGRSCHLHAKYSAIFDKLGRHWILRTERGHMFSDTARTHE